MNDLKWVAFEPNKKRVIVKQAWEQMVSRSHVSSFQLESDPEIEIIEIPKEPEAQKLEKVVIKEQNLDTKERMSITSLLNPK